MASPKIKKPSELEMQILSVLWRIGPSTVREVLAVFPDGKKRAYTSVLSIMQVMEKKGLLTRTREGLTDRWRPTMTKSSVLGPFLRRLVANVFGGEPAAVMQHLLQETDVDAAAIVAIRESLQAHQTRQAQNGGPAPRADSEPKDP